MRSAIKKIVFKLDFALVFLSVLVSIFAFQSHNARLVKKTKDYAVFENHNRLFKITSDRNKLEIYDGCKKIQEIPLISNFKIEEFKNLPAKRSNNCAIVAAATAGVAFAAFLKGAEGFLSMFGLATTELEGLFAMAANGATAAEVAAAIRQTLGFWAIMGGVTGLAV